MKTRFTTYTIFVAILLYTVIRGEVVNSCPEILDILSRVGNADHGLFTEVSAIAFWRRMYQIKIEHPEMSSADWIERAKRGHAHELAKLAEFMPKFICEHSNDGSIITTLEEFEGTLITARKLQGSLFKLGITRMEPILLSHLLR